MEHLNYVIVGAQGLSSDAVKWSMPGGPTDGEVPSSFIGYDKQQIQQMGDKIGVLASI